MNATPYAGTPPHLLTAGNVHGTAVPGAGALSKIAGPVGSLDLAACSLPVSSAEELAAQWDWCADQREKTRKQYAAEGHPQLALAAELAGDAYRLCASQLRRLAECAGKRQPAENVAGEPRPPGNP